MIWQFDPYESVAVHEYKGRLLIGAGGVVFPCAAIAKLVTLRTDLEIPTNTKVV